MLVLVTLAALAAVAVAVSLVAVESRLAMLPSALSLRPVVAVLLVGVSTEPRDGSSTWCQLALHGPFSSSTSTHLDTSAARRAIPEMARASSSASSASGTSGTSGTSGSELLPLRAAAEGLGAVSGLKVEPALDLAAHLLLVLVALLERARTLLVPAP